MKSMKFTLGLISILLLMSSTYEINNSTCGADDLKINPINLEFDNIPLLK